MFQIGHRLQNENALPVSWGAVPIQLHRKSVTYMPKLTIIEKDGGWTYHLSDLSGNTEEGPTYESEDAARRAGEDHNAGTW